MNLSLATQGGGSIEVSETNFGREFNEALVHQVVVAYMAATRQGSRAQKTRSEVRGGGRKPWRQKGTGRARAGTIRSPIWRGGGKAFAAKPQDHSQKVNRKMYRGALRCILSELVRQERLVVTESLNLDAPKTKALVAQLSALGIENALVVTEKPDRNVELSARNAKHIDTCSVASVDPVNLISHERVVVTVDALKALEEALN